MGLSRVRSLAIESGYHPILANLLPLCLDGLVLAGSITVLDAEMRGLSKRFGWTITLVGVFASVAANVTTAASLGVTSQVVHAVPPIALALALEAWLSTMRGTVRQQEAAAEAAAEAEALQSVDPTPEAVKGLVEQGFTQKDVASRFGVSTTTIQRLLKSAAGKDPDWAAEESA